MKVIQAPNRVEDWEKSLTIFLAGSIEMGEAERSLCYLWKRRNLF